MWGAGDSGTQRDGRASPLGAASRRAAGAAALAAATLLFLAAPVAARAPALRAGCSPHRPAIAYRPTTGLSGRALRHQPSRRPIPCLAVIRGRTSESAMVAVAATGRIFYAPLVENDFPAPLDDRGPALVAASDDGGARWGALQSGDSNHILDVPPWMDRDPQTGRIWFATVLPGLCGAEVSWSDSNGRTWQTNPAVGCPGMGSMRILEGPPPPGAARPVGYAHVVYYCANLSDFNQSNMWCYRSLDGGRNFSFTGSFPDPAPKAGCGTEHPARPGAVGPGGVLYFPVYQCGDLSVAISRDEGSTWQLVHVADSSVQDLYISSLAADGAGNLYLAWIAATPGPAAPPPQSGPNPATEGIEGRGEPTLSISRDHGHSWSRPAAIGPPGVRNAHHIAVTATASGKVAVEFLASPNGGPELSGYLAETGDALAKRPVWLGAPLNNPATPLVDANASESFGDRLFNFNDAFAPDGTAWAAFHCAKTTACPGVRFGVVGHFAKPSKPPHCVVARRITLALPHSPRARVVRVLLYVDGHRRLTRRGHDLRFITIGHLPRRRFHMRVVSTLSSGARIRTRLTYLGCGKGG